MPATDAFIAEVPVQLKNLREAAHQQSLEIQLRRDAQIKLHVERVVMRLERSRGSATGDALHHRRLHFQKVTIRHVAPHLRDHLAARDKNLAAALVRNQIQITLAVFDLRINDAVPLARHRPHGFRQHRQLRHFDRRLAHLGRECLTLDSHPVADINQLFECGEGFVARILRVKETLESSLKVRDIEKNRLPHIPPGAHPASNAHLRLVRKTSAQSRQSVADIELSAKRLNAAFAHLVQFFPPHPQEFSGVGYGCLGLVVRLLLVHCCLINRAM